MHSSSSLATFLASRKLSKRGTRITAMQYCMAKLDTLFSARDTARCVTAFGVAVRSRAKRVSLGFDEAVEPAVAACGADALFVDAAALHDSNARRTATIAG